MKIEDIIRMAREAGLDRYVNDVTGEPWATKLERFANLVAAQEREECAKLADKYMERWTFDAIRERGKK
jgi:hypothetical protein